MKRFDGRGKRFIEIDDNEVLIDSEKAWYNTGINVTPSVKFKISKIDGIEIFKGDWETNPYIEFIVAGSDDKTNYIGKNAITGTKSIGNSHGNYPYIVFIKKAQIDDASRLRDEILSMVDGLKSNNNNTLNMALL